MFGCAFFSLSLLLFLHFYSTFLHEYLYIYKFCEFNLLTNSEPSGRTTAIPMFSLRHSYACTSMHSIHTSAQTDTHTFTLSLTNNHIPKCDRTRYTFYFALFVCISNARYPSERVYMYLCIVLSSIWMYHQYSMVFPRAYTICFTRSSTMLFCLAVLMFLYESSRISNEQRQQIPNSFKVTER